MISLEGLDPDVTVTNILPMLLKLERLVTGAVFDTTIGVLHGDIVMHLMAVPPEGKTSRLLQLASLPVSSLEDEVEGMPLTIGSPGISFRNMLHANRSDSVRTDFPVIGILGILALG